MPPIIDRDVGGGIPRLGSGAGASSGDRGAAIGHAQLRGARDRRRLRRIDRHGVGNGQRECLEPTRLGRGARVSNRGLIDLEIVNDRLRIDKHAGAESQDEHNGRYVPEGSPHRCLERKLQLIHAVAANRGGDRSFLIPQPENKSLVSGR